MVAGEDDVASNDRGTITSNILSSMLLGASTMSAGAPNNGKDKVVDQLLRALKLFRRCKMIENELEMQFKLIQYLTDIYLKSK